MPKKTTDKAERLVPGSARVLVQLYRPSGRLYTMAPGMSVSGIAVGSQRELKRLWRELENVINAARWRDINQEPDVHQDQITQ